MQSLRDRHSTHKVTSKWVSGTLSSLHPSQALCSTALYLTSESRTAERRGSMTRKKKSDIAKSPSNSAEWEVGTGIHQPAGLQVLLHKEGLLLLDIYAAWAGPCNSISFFINKFNAELQVMEGMVPMGQQVKTGREVNFLSVNSYAVPELAMFKGQCYPVFVMVKDGEMPRAS